MAVLDWRAALFVLPPSSPEEAATVPRRLPVARLKQTRGTGRLVTRADSGVLFCNMTLLYSSL